MHTRFIELAGEINESMPKWGDTENNAGFRIGKNIKWNKGSCLKHLTKKISTILVNHLQ